MSASGLYSGHVEVIPGDSDDKVKVYFDLSADRVRGLMWCCAYPISGLLVAPLLVRFQVFCCLCACHVECHLGFLESSGLRSV